MEWIGLDCPALDALQRDGMARLDRTRLHWMDWNRMEWSELDQAGSGGLQWQGTELNEME